MLYFKQDADLQDTRGQEAKDDKDSHDLKFLSSAD